MELKDLVGFHELSGVDFVDIEWQKEEFPNDDPDIDTPIRQVMRFRLDSVVYKVVENPEDGYRSHVRYISEDNGILPMVNVFPPFLVACEHRQVSKDGFEKDDVLVMTDCRNSEEILEVGTENTNDYYPCFVAAFHSDRIYSNN